MTRRKLRSMVLAAALGVGAACGRGSDTQPVVLALDSTGVTVVSDELPQTLTTRELRRFQVPGGEDRRHRVWALARLADDAIAYWERAERRIVVRLSDGSSRYLPGSDEVGEFESVIGLVSCDGRQLVVLDSNRDRVTVIGSDGDDTSTFRVPMVVSSATPLVCMGEQMIAVPSVDVSREDGQQRRYARRVLVYRLNGELVGGWLLPLSGKTHESFAVGPFRNFVVETLQAIGRGGLFAIGRNDAYTFRFGTSDRAMTVRRSWEPVPIDDEERNAWNTYLARAERNLGVRIPIPPAKPAYRRLIVDDVQRLWVERYTTGVKREEECLGDSAYPQLCVIEPLLYDIFDLSGAYLGSVSLSPRERFLAAGDSTLWVARTTASGEDIVEYGLDLPDS